MVRTACRLIIMLTVTGSVLAAGLQIEPPQPDPTIVISWGR